MAFSSGMEGLPTRFHIGTQKAGSTYLYNLLASHTDVALSEQTEINFFSTNYDKGVGWYQRVAPRERHGVVVSPANFKFGAKSAARMAQVYGKQKDDLRLVLIVRNPVDYLYSHWRMHRMHGYFRAHPELYPEVPGDIVSFVERYPEYLKRACYSELLGEWTEYFTKEQFKIVMFEDFVKNTDEVMRSMLSFWEIPYGDMSVGQTSKNKALRFRFLHTLRGWVARRSALKRVLKNNRLFNVILEHALTKETREELIEKERRRLAKLLAGDVFGLPGEYGVDVSWWKDFARITGEV